MQCPLLSGRYTKQCGAVKVVVVLSKDQLELYCETGDYQKCPVYMTWKSLSGKNVGLADYARVSEKEKASSNVINDRS